MSQFWIKENDRLPYLEKTLVDGSGVPVDLTGASAVSFTLLDDNGDALWTHAATIVAPATSGRVRYAWGLDAVVPDHWVHRRSHLSAGRISRRHHKC